MRYLGFRIKHIRSTTHWRFVGWLVATSDHIPYSHPLSYGEICYFGTRVCHSSHLSYVSFRFVAHIFQKKRRRKNECKFEIYSKKDFFSCSSRHFDCILPLSVFASDPYIEISVSKPLSVHSLALTPVTYIHNSTIPHNIDPGLKWRYAIVSVCLVRSKWPNHNFVPFGWPIFHTHTDCTHSALLSDVVANILKWISIIAGSCWKKKKQKSEYDVFSHECHFYLT